MVARSKESDDDFVMAYNRPSPSLPLISDRMATSLLSGPRFDDDKEN